MNYYEPYFDGTTCKINIDKSDKSVANKIIKHFMKGEMMYFFLHREDGNFDDEEDTIKYRKELPEFFKKNGRYEVIYDANLEKKFKSFSSAFSYLASLPINELTLQTILIIFDYYLETMILLPSKLLNWNIYSQLNYPKFNKTAVEYIKEGYVDSLFLSVEWGSFSYIFDTTKYDVNLVVNEIRNFSGIS